MSVTRSGVENVLVSRLRQPLVFAGMSVVTDGTNDDLNDPIAWALMRLGITPSNPLDVTNSDITAVANADLAALLDLAEYRALLTLQSRMEAYDITVGPRTEKYSDLTDSIDKKLDRLKKDLQDSYGIGAGAISMGAVDLNFQTRGDDDIEYE